MRSAYKGMVGKVLTGENANRTADVVKGAHCRTGTGRATVKLIKRNGGKASAFRISVRSLRFVRYSKSVKVNLLK